MGRTEASLGRAPAAFRKDARAKKAKATLNQLVPSLLSAHPRARRGIDATTLITEPPKQGAPAQGAGPRIVLQVADTLVAAKRLRDRALAAHESPRVAILNMASPLSPGGGFLNGASSQEESLCMRTTLLPSLRDEYYRLPELGTVYTPDVLVFRDEPDDDEVLPKSDRWHVDCLTAAMLRNPETERDENGRGRYVQPKDRDLVLQKMRMVLRICQMKGNKTIVLGAWGCGAYGNPVGEIAAAWHKVLLPRADAKEQAKGKRETWAGLDRVVFAIKDPGMAEAFEAAFGEGLEHEEESVTSDDEADEEAIGHRELDPRELQNTIKELESRIDAAPSAQLKDALNSIRLRLQSQLLGIETEAAVEDDTASEDSDENSEIVK